MKRRNWLMGAGLFSGLTIAQVANADKPKMPKMPDRNPIAPPKAYEMPGSDPKMLRGKMVTIADKLQGYQVMPQNMPGPYPTVLVIMEAFGLNDQIKGVCDLFAKYGYAAIAPDIYEGAVFPYDKIGDAVGKLKTLKDERVVKQFGQTLDYVANQSQMRSDAVGTVGFCMGGRYSFLISASFPDRIHSAVCFYGGGIAAAPDPLGRASLLPLIPKLKAPVMFIYSAEDEYINGAEHARIAEAMTENRKRYILSVVPNTQHGFMNDARPTYNASAAMEAWDMAFGFFKRHVKKQVKA